MKILLITQWFYPEPSQLILEMLESFRAAGHEVTVLTGFPNYPSGNIYPGYRIRLFQRETIEGINVVRVPLYPDHGHSALKRAANYASFACSCLFLAPWLLSRFDVIHVYNLITLGPAAWLLGLINRAPFTYEIQDLWPESLEATNMVRNRRVLTFVGWFAKAVYRRAAAIRVISPGFRNNLIEKGVPPEKIHVISNWVDADFYRPRQPDSALAEKHGLADRFNIMFAGTIGLAQGLETVLDAAALLKDLPRLQFVLVGDGADLGRLEKLASERGLTNVRFLGRHPVEQMPAFYALADVLLLHLHDDPLFRITIPHKLFTYMAGGKPVLAAMAGDAADVVCSARAGIACSPGDPQAMAEAARQLYRLPPEELHAMGQRGQQTVREQYGQDFLVDKLLKMMQSVVKS